MQITEVKIRMINDEKTPEVKAVADIVFDNSFAVHGINIIKTPNKYYILMPSRVFADGETKEQVHPIDSAFREYITETVVGEYLKELE